jgi:serine/threonine-protein kinase
MKFKRGTRLGRYEITGLIGAGGMGEVYRGRDVELERDVAIKVLSVKLESDNRGIERFQREARAVAQMSHPNILEIYDFGESDGTHFAVMELLEGQSLRDRLNGSGLTTRKAIEIAKNIAGGLSAAHGCGIVHRDIKPENIFLTSDGRVKILDFGIAHLAPSPHGGKELDETAETVTSGQGMVGTIGYLSPEQIRGESVTAATDVFSLGCVLFEMITDCRAFARDTPSATLAAIVSEDPLPISGFRPEAPPGLDNLVGRCLEKQPTERFESAHDLALALEAFSEASRTYGHAALKPSSRQKVFRKRASWTLLALALLSLIVVGFRERLFGSPPLPDRKHVAVVSFQATSGGEEDRQMAAGFAEILRDGLTVLEEQTWGSMWVVPGSEMRIRKLDSPMAVFKDFDVSLVVTGDLDIADDHARLSISLVKPETGQILRSIEVSGGLGNLPSFQQAPTVRIAELLGIEPNAESMTRIEQLGTDVTAAFLPYVQAKGLLFWRQAPEDIDQAIELLKTALAADTLFARAREALVGAYVLKYRETGDSSPVEAGLEQVERLLDRDGRSTSYRALGALHRRSGKIEDAITALEQAVLLAPASAETHLELGTAYRLAGRVDEAEELYQRAISRRPGYWRGHHRLAILFYRAGRFDAAMNEFRRVTNCAPNNHDAHNNLGGMLFSLGRLEEAEQEYQRSYEIDPDENYPAISNLGTLYFQKGRFSDAAAMYERALAEDDSDYQISGNLGYIYAWGPNPEAAVPHFRRAIDLAEAAIEQSSDDSELLADLAGLYTMIGDIESATELQSRAISLKPTDPTVLATIATTFEKLGEREKALDWLSRSLQGGVNAFRFERNPDLRELIADERYREIVDKHRGEFSAPAGEGRS